MSWKEHLRTLEKAKQWDEAIEFMQKVIQENPNDMDAYLFMNYLLMNLLMEENYDESKKKEYKTLLKWYFDESYAKFSGNPEYLYLTARTAVMAEWLFGISIKDYKDMIDKAHELEPQNPLYKENYYWYLLKHDPYNPELTEYFNLLLTPNSCIEQQLKDKGAVGEYILKLDRNWARNTFASLTNEKKQKYQKQ